MATGPAQRQFISAAPWFVATAASLPIWLLYAAHFLLPLPGHEGTGFIQDDQPYYMANARALLNNWPSVVYGLPFSPDDGTPRIYFQPLTVFLAFLLRYTHLMPGHIYAAVGAVASVTMFRAALYLIDASNGRPRDGADWLGRLVMLWGGGVLFLAGSLHIILTGGAGAAWTWIGEAFRYDPFDGYWFLNLGRNGIYTTEAFYHTVFFSACGLLLARRHAPCLVLVALMSCSHAFTGVQLILIMGAFAAAECLLFRSDAPPAWFPAGLLILLVIHLSYYLVALKWLSPDHVVLEKQWTLAWTLPLATAALAYGPVLVAAIASFGQLPGRTTRFLIAWFLVSLALTNHELFITPHQPLHFTRGYVWTPLALLGLPAISQVLRKAMNHRHGIVLCAMVLSIVLLDNIAWFGRAYAVRYVGAPTAEFYLARDSAAVLARLAEADLNRRLLLADDLKLSYLAITYSGTRSWYSHRYNTPDALQKRDDVIRFFATSHEPAAWQDRPIVVVTTGTRDHLLAAGFAASTTIGRYQLLTRDPR